ncbi:MFS transporter [Polaribacter marinivivus]|uniref:MFS transporter n=1 Tax=Polaribacter marinivivus TaxID=1524260 RepID=A0ABV8RAN4_9FLAO
MNSTFFIKLYKWLHDNEDEIKDDLPKNYFLLLLSSTFTKLGDTLSNPKTVLTWVMTIMNAPVYLISLIVPIRESGSMLPQIVLGNYVKTKEKRKRIYIFGALLQCVAIFAMGLTAYNFEGVLGGFIIVFFLIIFSLSRSLCSLSSKDVLGKVIPKQSRGKLKGYTSSVSGVLVLIAGLFLIYKSKEDTTILFYSLLLIFASSMWLLAALFYSSIKEPKSEVEKTRISLKNSFCKLTLLKSNKHFRKFIIARSLLLCSSLSAPFYVLLAQRNIGKDAYLLGLFILVNGIASVISAPIWGKMADKSSKNVMSIASLVASFLGILMVVILVIFKEISSLYWIYPVAFFILGIAHSGVRLGRKTYIVDMAEGNKRTDFVAISNTIIGLILLITGGLSALASIFSVEAVLLLLSLFGVFGAYRSYQLPNVEEN